MKITKPLFLLFSIISFNPAFSQSEIDTLTNNLVHVPGYETSEWGMLSCHVYGKGKQPLLLLPGAGFDGSIFQQFVEDNLERYTMYVLTLPGYGNTNAYPMPPEEESYSQQNWINGVINGILQLIEERELDRPALAGHFLISSHIALRMAVEHSDKVGKVIIIGSPAELKSPPPYDTLGYANRVKFTDKYLAPLWYKTVSRQTWLDGNFLPETYSLDSVQAKQFWQTANEAPLPVHIEYLCENWGADFAEYKQVKVPVLVLVPSFQSNILEKTCNSYLESWSFEKWKNLADANENIKVQLVDGTACNIMYDQPKFFDELVNGFLGN